MFMEGKLSSMKLLILLDFSLFKAVSIKISINF